MSAILNRTQPQGLVQVDWENPITKGLAFIYVVNGLNLVGWSASNANPKVIAASGAKLPQPIGQTITMAAGNAIDVVNDSIGGKTNYGLFAYGTANSTGAVQNAIDDDNQSGGQRAFQFRLNASQVEMIVFDTGSTPYFATGPALSINQLEAGFTLGASVSGNTFASFSNGIKTPGTAANTQKTPNSTVNLGNNKLGGSNWAAGGLALFIAWSRTPTDAEMVSMAKSPWQLFVDPLSEMILSATVATASNQCFTSFNQISRVRW